MTGLFANTTARHGNVAFRHRRRNAHRAARIPANDPAPGPRSYTIDGPQIGTTEHFVCPDLDELTKVRQRKGRLAKSAASNSCCAMAAAARKIMAGTAENTHRAADPFEQARQYLQRKGHVIYAASVYRREGQPLPPADIYVWSGKGRFTKAEIIELAAERGWRP